MIPELAFSIARLKSKFTDLHLVVRNAPQAERERIQDAMSRGGLSNFIEGDCRPAACDKFSADIKLLLGWQGPRRVVTALNEHVYKVGDLRNGMAKDLHGTRIKPPIAGFRGCYVAWYCVRDRNIRPMLNAPRRCHRRHDVLVC